MLNSIFAGLVNYLTYGKNCYNCGTAVKNGDKCKKCGKKN